MNFNINLDQLMTALSRPSPARDWMIVLGILVALAISGIAYGSYLFIGIRWGGLSGTSQEAPAAQGPAVTSAQIDKVLAAYRARRANFESGNYDAPIPANQK